MRTDFALEEYADGTHSLTVPLRQSEFPAATGSHPQRRKLRAYVLAGRSSACFFESARNWLTCQRGVAAATSGRHSSSLGDGLSWSAQSRARTRIRVLIAQGLLHSLCFTLCFVCFPSIYTVWRIIPNVSHEWAVDFARWIGLRSVTQIEHIVRLFLTGLCVLLLVLTTVAFLATAITDPGRVPQKYHWITTAVKCGAVAPQSSVPASQRRLAVAQLLGLGVNDVAYFEMQYHSSSYAPALHVDSFPSSGRSSFDASSQPEIVRLRRKAKVYLSYRSVRIWQALMLSEDRASLWSVPPQEDPLFDESLMKETEGNLEVPTDVNGLCDGVRVRLKWCAICQHVRLPRTRHCTSCQCCVDRFDHHCVWVCNCVGLRNHRYFVAFIFFACSLNSVILVLCASLYHELWQQTGHVVDAAGEHWWDHFMSMINHHWILIKMIPVEFILLLLSFLLFFPLVNLILFHAVLVATNRTTTEEMRELYLIKNPFSLGFRHNVHHLLCAPVPPSLTTRWGVARELKCAERFTLEDSTGTNASYSRSRVAPPRGLV
eukprot:Gregarina_sp_Pseudo_9__5591@NODE_759_length_2259_cov_6_604955_g715_i0_p1_GENE_NODE_759_length_2259_cov_6_604955_g715_i0NODE_759_length_2259_cov_6_604955_g715_i0_p1_ORF_typecomplete_len575_score27_41DHHC/PF01529_20/85DHHC/PF01529_20/4_8e31Skp1/PF01466_19/2e02Skp1/PF01466_19/6_8_NODE_759_length_2259_cov_6_604955_g715_i05342168